MFSSRKVTELRVLVCYFLMICGLMATLRAGTERRSGWLSSSSSEMILAGKTKGRTCDSNHLELKSILNLVHRRTKLPIR
jgi:hypothetical protein